MSRGYHDCACPDCFEIAFGESDFCAACKPAGCDGKGECRVPHAYCSGDSRADDDDVIVDDAVYCPVCGQHW